MGYGVGSGANLENVIGHVCIWQINMHCFLRTKLACVGQLRSGACEYQGAALTRLGWDNSGIGKFEASRVAKTCPLANCEDVIFNDINDGLAEITLSLRNAVPGGNCEKFAHDVILWVESTYFATPAATNSASYQVCCSDVV